jgi:hypothetical protein
MDKLAKPMLFKPILTILPPPQLQVWPELDALAREPGLGPDFLAEVEQALTQILTTPEGFQKIGRRVRLSG